MSDSSEISGKCLCGAVSFKAQPEAPHVGACHCKMCRQWGSGPFVEVNCGTSISFEGEENIKTFSSSDWAERGFCGTCGSNLFYRLKHSGETMLAAGLVDNLDDYKMTMQVFIDEKPDYYTFADKTEKMTGQEVFEKFG